MKNKIFLISVALFLVVILCALIYYFPFQKVRAEIKFKEYSARQGVVESDIESKKVQKDYKQDGYVIFIRYKSNPGFLYEYHYFFINPWGKGKKFDAMMCDVYKSENGYGGELLDDYSEVVYKPLEHRN